MNSTANAQPETAPPYKSWTGFYTKRALDIFGAVFTLVLTAPFLLAATLLIKLSIGSPVFFRQRRIGYKGKPFTIIKLRTMLDLYNEHGELLPDSDRLTPLGNFLRHWSLDELPQLFNVLKGDLSLVGPRPHLWIYRDRFSPEQWKRHDVFPGITGWAQINGRNSLTWTEKLKLDCWYVENRSILLDLKILLVTPWKILKREGITQPGYATVAEFQGVLQQQAVASADESIEFGSVVWVRNVGEKREKAEPAVETRQVRSIFDTMVVDVGETAERVFSGNGKTNGKNHH